MQLRHEDMNNLMRLQRVDLDIARSKKEFDELPARKEHASIREKIAQVEQKARALASAQRQLTDSIAQAEAEDARLAEEQEGAQARIDAAGTNYRSIESDSKKLRSLGDKRAACEKRLEKLYADSEKAAGLRRQIEEARSALASEDRRWSESLEAARAEYGKKADALADRRDDLASQLPADLLKRYAASVARGGGVGVGVLSEGKCGSCRTPLEHGKLIELRAHAPLGVCPNCGRLLIVAD